MLTTVTLRKLFSYADLILKKPLLLLGCAYWVIIKLKMVVLLKVWNMWKWKVFSGLIEVWKTGFIWDWNLL